MDPREMSANFLCPAWGDSIRTPARRGSPQPKGHKGSVPGKRAAPRPPHPQEDALLTGPLHPETLMAPRERPQGTKVSTPLLLPKGPMHLGFEGSH